MLKKTILLLGTIWIVTIQANSQAPHGVVYIESNIGHVPGQNSILAFTRDSAGHLAPSGEYSTGGMGIHPLPINPGNLPGTLGPFDSDQNLVFNWDATRIFAVNSGVGYDCRFRRPRRWQPRSSEGVAVSFRRNSACKPRAGGRRRYPGGG